MRRGWLLGVALVILAGTHAAAGQSRYAGRPLADVLGELSRSGLALVYSSRVVLPDLVVLAEPASTLPRRVLDEILAPHGLRVEAGAKGRLLIVRVGPPK